MRPTTAPSHTSNDSTRRLELVACLASLVERGLLTQTSGNVSMRADDGLVLITPASMSYDRIGPDDLALIDLDGNIVSAPHRPSSEVPLHLSVYAARRDIEAIVHTHSPLATTFAVLNQPIPAVHYMLTTLEQTRIEVCPYAVFGSRELADNVTSSFRAPARALLLANHGMVAGAPTIAQAAAAAETVELLAGLYHRALAVGTPRVLSDDQLAEVAAQIAALSYAKSTR